MLAGRAGFHERAVSHVEGCFEYGARREEARLHRGEQEVAHVCRSGHQLVTVLLGFEADRHRVVLVLVVVALGFEQLDGRDDAPEAMLVEDGVSALAEELADGSLALASADPLTCVELGDDVAVIRLGLGGLVRFVCCLGGLVARLHRTLFLWGSGPSYYSIFLPILKHKQCAKRPLSPR